MRTVCYLFFLLFFLSLLFHFLQTKVYGIENPLSVSNNKFGVHIAIPTQEEASTAALLVNSTGGDWGYATVVIEQHDRNIGKWQAFFDHLRRLHLIPIVRLATKPTNDYWERPASDEPEQWADFLNKLNWPTKNRYIIVYNEPNHAKEWGNTVNPAEYAQILDKTRNALKEKSNDFFVLNAGLDASAPHKPPDFYDELLFLKEMEGTVPGIFEKLDGWVSHSYPNPGFVGLPTSSGRGTVRTFAWEQEALRSLNVKKTLPIFITETGWQHSEGITQNIYLPTPQTVGQYFKTAHELAWKSREIVAVTPFILNYQGAPFDHFSFKRLDNAKKDSRVLGLKFPDFHEHFKALADMVKPKGEPAQENKARLIKGQIYSSIVTGETYLIPLTFKNIGQSIWEKEQVKLATTKGGESFDIKKAFVTGNIEPGGEYTFEINVTAPKEGKYKIALNLFNKDREFDSPDFDFTTEVKPPVILVARSKLLWKNDFSGAYRLKITGSDQKKAETVLVSKEGQSEELIDRRLLPGQTFNFTLERPFYKSKTVRQTVFSGANIIDFETLYPDFLSVILNPRELWKLLPFSNK